MSHLDQYLHNGELGSVLLIDKPVGLTSFDVIYRLRRWHGVVKAGHAGTLDPLASGLLIICMGKETKNLHRFSNLDKEYVGTMELGIQTPSFDMETEVSERMDVSGVTIDGLKSIFERFVGRQLQMPPMYSAVKHKGKPLYKYARRGKILERKPREIEIRELVLTGFAPPKVEFKVLCSKGTYIRSLANDIGAALGCGAALTALRRTRIGAYTVENAVTLEQLEATKKANEPRSEEANDYRIPA
ncbi:MAG TPA: tRNA pseudouridine(55) synthase TruB [Bacteroidetes bacterium]|nr:tRNA pseudouridine(55) synthase TruB [Bacteroidota bacterium]